MTSPTHIMISSTECEAGREAECHDWYDTVHIPDLLAIPGIVSAKRYATTASEGVDGARKLVSFGGEK